MLRGTMSLSRVLDTRVAATTKNSVGNHPLRSVQFESYRRQCYFG